MCSELESTDSMKIIKIREADEEALKQESFIGHLTQYYDNSNSDLLKMKAETRRDLLVKGTRGDTIHSFWESAHTLIRRRKENREKAESMKVSLNMHFKDVKLPEDIHRATLTKEERDEAHRESQSSIKSEEKIAAKKLAAKEKEQKKREKNEYEAYLANGGNIVFADSELLKSSYVDDLLKEVAYYGPSLSHFEGYTISENYLFPDSPYTHRQMLEVVQDGDYSHMEDMNPLLRNVAASEYMRNLEVAPGATADSFIESLLKTENLKFPRRNQYIPSYESKGGVKELMNPLLRIGLSLCMRDESYKTAFPSFARVFDTAEKVKALEAKMNARIMAETISTIPDYYEMQADQDAEKMGDDLLEKSIVANRKSQIFMAKNMLAAQLGKFVKKTNGVEDSWTGPVADAFAHCSRVGIILPGKTGKEYKDKNRDATTDAFLGAGKGKAAGFKSRLAATHAIHTKKKNSGRNFEELKKDKGWICGQYGMNVAIGGLGNPGLGGFRGKSRRFTNDGTCGHIYMHIEDGDKNNYTGLLIGFESDKPGMTNQMGHTHGAGNGEFASSFGGQRLDEVGDKYGGRVIDLSYIDEDAFQITMTGMDKVMETLLVSEKPEDILMLRSISESLCGERMSAKDKRLRDIVKLCVSMSPILGNNNIDDVVKKVLLTAGLR